MNFVSIVYFFWISEIYVSIHSFLIAFEMDEMIIFVKKQGVLAIFLLCTKKQ